MKFLAFSEHQELRSLTILVRKSTESLSVPVNIPELNKKNPHILLRLFDWMCNEKSKSLVHLHLSVSKRKNCCQFTMYSHWNMHCIYEICITCLILCNTHANFSLKQKCFIHPALPSAFLYSILQFIWPGNVSRSEYRENHINYKKGKESSTNHNRVFLYRLLQLFIYIALYIVL